MNVKQKFYLAACAVAASPFAVFADETSGSGTTETTDVASQIVSESSDVLQGMLTNAGTVVTDLVIAGLAIWGGIALVGILKRAFSAGKGR